MAERSESEGRFPALAWTPINLPDSSNEQIVWDMLWEEFYTQKE